MGTGTASAIATLGERTSRYVLLQRLPYDYSAERVAYALTAAMNRLPALLKRSLTWDQGPEMARHATFTTLTGIPVFFCDPHSPWQRGMNENTNGLLCEYFPREQTCRPTIRTTWTRSPSSSTDGPVKRAGLSSRRRS